MIIKLVSKGRSVVVKPSKKVAVAAVTILVLAIGILAFGYVFEAIWAGVKGKRLWDWLDLLIVPAILLLAGTWMSYKVEEHAQDMEARQAKERELDAYLQHYFGQIQRLLIQENSLGEENADDARKFAEGHTYTLLKDLDPIRKGRLLTFLYESHLIDTSKSKISLCGADVSGAKIGR